MVGRILGRLRRTSELREPIGRRISVRRRVWRRPHAVRLPADHRIAGPADLVELDTLDIRPPGTTHPLKQFTARDRASRWTWSSSNRSATAIRAREALVAVLERMPFGVRSISVDGGSEFMAEFEAACEARGIRLFVLPPRSPKLHGSVQRANRTLR
jgi:putative transposase